MLVSDTRDVAIQYALRKRAAANGKRQATLAKNVTREKTCPFFYGGRIVAKKKAAKKATKKAGKKKK